jgi:hypothetical protein
MLSKVEATTRIWITERPWLYPKIRSVQAALGWIRSQSFCTKESDLCLEGYPACANSFLYFAFQECAEGGLSIGHHTHSVSNVKRALRLDIPVLIVYRDPYDAIPSYLSRFDKDPFVSTIRYVRFYRYIRRIADDIQLISFEEVTAKVELAIRKVASVSDLDWRIRDVDTLEERARSRMDQQWSDEDDYRFNPRDIPLPNEDRSSAKERARQTIQKLEVYEEARREYEYIKDLRN